MDLVVKCPKDGRLLGEVNSKGEFLGVCGSCGLAYGVHLGTLAGRNSRQESIQRQTSKQRGIYRRIYELRLNQPGGRLYTLEFSISGKNDRITVRKGDVVAVLYQADSKGELQSVLRVDNKTTGDSHFVSSPKTVGDVGWIAFTAGIIFICGLVVLGGAGFPAMATLIISLIPAGSFGFYAIRRKIKRNKVQLPPEKIQQAQETHGLLKEKLRIGDRINELRAELSASQEQFTRLKTLHDRMVRTDATAYASRIATLKKAGTLLNQSIKGSQQLLAQYSKALEIIDIEYESGQVSADFASEPDSLIAKKLEELKTAESQVAALQAQLQANEEVKKLGGR
jgi:hypothetical protein